jgi:hypothetical protein
MPRESTIAVSGTSKSVSQPDAAPVCGAARILIAKMPPKWKRAAADDSHCLDTSDAETKSHASKFGYGRGSNRELLKIKKRDQITSIIVAFLVLLSALFIILSGHYHETEQKWAYGAVGTIVGVMLRTKR